MSDLIEHRENILIFKRIADEYYSLNINRSYWFTNEFLKISFWRIKKSKNKLDSTGHWKFIAYIIFSWKIYNCIFSLYLDVYLSFRISSMTHLFIVLDKLFSSEATLKMIVCLCLSFCNVRWMFDKRNFARQILTQYRFLPLCDVFLI